MLFYIYTCDYDEEGNISCRYKECEKVKGIKIDERIIDDPAKVPSHLGKSDWWYEKGKNHRIENEHIKRDFDDEFFIIELNSLEDLMIFQDKYNITASISRGSDYIHNGEKLNSFHCDY